MESNRIIEPMKVNGKGYYTVEQFAIITGKTPGHILRMVLYGNRIRKMDSTKMLNKTMIPVEELTNFPFNRRGRGEITEVYHFCQNGEKVYEKIETYLKRMGAKNGEINNS